jgi:hypothetical protein
MRLFRSDAALDAMNDEREHLAIQISLLDDAEAPNVARLAALRQALIMLERRISHHKPI